MSNRYRYLLQSEVDFFAHEAVFNAKHDKEAHIMLGRLVQEHLHLLIQPYPSRNLPATWNADLSSIFSPVNLLYS
jgi:hypothetical protein